MHANQILRLLGCSCGSPVLQTNRHIVQFRPLPRLRIRSLTTVQIVDVEQRLPHAGSLDANEARLLQVGGTLGCARTSMQPALEKRSEKVHPGKHDRGPMEMRQHFVCEGIAKACVNADARGVNGERERGTVQ